MERALGQRHRGVVGAQFLVIGDRHDLGEVAGEAPVVREGPKVGRNDPCPCGSGKKHKKCCGAPARA